MVVSLKSSTLKRLKLRLEQSIILESLFASSNFQLCNSHMERMCSVHLANLKFIVNKFDHGFKSKKSSESKHPKTRIDKVREHIYHLRSRGCCNSFRSIENKKKVKEWCFLSKTRIIMHEGYPKSVNYMGASFFYDEIYQDLLSLNYPFIYFNHILNIFSTFFITLENIFSKFVPQ